MCIRYVLYGVVVHIFLYVLLVGLDRLFLSVGFVVYF